MQLISFPIACLRDASQKYVILKKRFDEFLNRLAFFTEPDSVKGVTVEISKDREYCKVSFATVSVGYRFLLKRNKDGAFVGCVLCMLERPLVTERPLVLGSFEFDINGRTNFEVANPEIDDLAAIIVAHFLLIALMTKID